MGELIRESLREALARNPSSDEDLLFADDASYPGPVPSRSRCRPRRLSLRREVLIFIDTGAFIARYLERDAHHARAIKAWKKLPRKGSRTYTSNFVLDETITLLGRRSDYHFATERARNLYASRSLEVLRPNHEDEIDALRWFEKFLGSRT